MWKSVLLPINKGLKQGPEYKALPKILNMK